MTTRSASFVCRFSASAGWPFSATVVTETVGYCSRHGTMDASNTVLATRWYVARSSTNGSTVCGSFTGYQDGGSTAWIATMDISRSAASAKAYSAAASARSDPSTPSTIRLVWDAYGSQVSGTTVTGISACVAHANAVDPNITSVNRPVPCRPRTSIGAPRAARRSPRRAMPLRTVSVMGTADSP